MLANKFFISKKGKEEWEQKVIRHDFIVVILQHSGACLVSQSFPKFLCFSLERFFKASALCLFIVFCENVNIYEMRCNEFSARFLELLEVSVRSENILVEHENILHTQQKNEL